jgi:SAM-dependent methyltransferase
MERREEILRFVRTGQTGVEIGPWFNPLVPKSQGYNTLVLDVFDRTQLVASAIADPGIPDSSIDLIEEVDLVGPVHMLDEMVAARGLTGSLDFLVSSHNLEHFPDPIRFLQACQAILKPGGVVALALPDKRACFDFFRPVSDTGELLQAFWERRERPTPAQIFSHIAMHSYNHLEGQDRSGWGLGQPTGSIRLVCDIAEAYHVAKLHFDDPDQPYRDTHCWSFTPSSFEAILLELQIMGLVQLSVRTVVAPGGHEFMVHLVNDPAGLPQLDTESIKIARSAIHHKIVQLT